MKLLANENFPVKSVHYLKKKGFDVLSIGTDNQGVKDSEIMRIADEEERMILTFDRDYGELIFKHNFKPRKGVIYLRLELYQADEPGKIIEGLIADNKTVFDNALTVVDERGIRQRKY